MAIVPHNFLVRANRAMDVTQALIDSGTITSEERQWFAGFVDAEGCLGMYKNQTGILHFSIGQRDSTVLQRLRTLLNKWHIALFSIKERPNICKEAYSKMNVPELRTHVVKTCARLFVLLNGAICHPNKLAILAQWAGYLDQPIKTSTITWPWLAGFFDGDGSLYANKKRNCLYVQITQKNKEILKEIISFTGFGYIRPFMNSAQEPYFMYVCSRRKAIEFLQKIKPHQHIINKNLNTAENIITLTNKGGELINDFVRTVRHEEVIFHENLNIGGSLTR